LGELARGGQGVVYRAHQPGVDRQLAIKLLFASTPKHLARFKQEAQVLARLAHPNLPRVLELGEHQGRPFIAMEFLEGVDLAGVMKETGPLEPARAVEVLGAIADALHYCHEKGVVHRDLKPANVMLETGTARPVLVDFGLLRQDPDSLGGLSDDEQRIRLTKTGEMLGTPGYMAPEQTDSRLCGITPRTDVYALGATLYALLTGEAPFRGETRYNVILKVLKEAPPDPRVLRANVPGALAELCARSMAKDPDARPESAAAFAESLRGALSPASPSRLLPAIAVGATVLVLGSVGGALALRPEESPSRDSRGVATTSTASLSEDPALVEPAFDPALGPRWYQALPVKDRAPFPLPAGLQFGGEGEYVNLKDESVLVWIPPGSFRMGTNKRAGQGPEHSVTFTRGFFFAKFEVTWGQFQRFWVSENEKRYPAWVIEVGFVPTDSHPAHGVPFGDAMAYAEWAGLRVPLDPEWEFAARGPKSAWPFPWGDGLIEEHANGPGPEDRFLHTAPIGSFLTGRSPFGCLDMIGNVREWTLVPGAHAYTTEPRTDPVAGLLGVPTPCQRGGSYGDDVNRISVTDRVDIGGAPPEIQVGIRLARSPD
jgi:serine/threonine protein kinase